MKKLHQKRLLNVAKALRESENPKAFDMTYFFHGDSGTLAHNNVQVTNFECGTPACALGHYADRTDLQRSFRNDLQRKTLVSTRCGYLVEYMGTAVNRHFGITADEAVDLFGPSGCGGARGPRAAARFIELFVAKKMKEARK